MVSIIICSINSKRLQALRKNIEETIGLPHEIIAIDNSNRQFGICSVYNMGGQKAKYPFLCFMHEDVMIETENWGDLVCRHLINPSVGLIGIAGGDAKSLIPSSWSIPVFSNEVNIVQHYRNNLDQPQKKLETGNKYGSGSSQVVVLDGVWLCTRKEIFIHNHFDERTFKGFHGYDIDYSLQIGTRYKLLVIFDITIHHFSEGSPGKDWLNSAMAISKKWKKTLPVSIYADNDELMREHHWKTMQVFLQHMSRLKLNPFTQLSNFLRYSVNQYFNLRRFLSMCRYFLTSGS